MVLRPFGQGERDQAVAEYRMYRCRHEWAAWGSHENVPTHWWCRRCTDIRQSASWEPPPKGPDSELFAARR